jgi:hypothetical protein
MTPSVFSYPGVDIIYMRAPNRYRKMLKNSDLPVDMRDPFGIDYPIHSECSPKQMECISAQVAEFGEQYGKPIGFQATWDNDIAIAWEPERRQVAMGW